MALLLCVSMLVGTTYAWFTDTVESGSNIIKTGNLDVEFEYYKGTEYVDVQGATDIFDPNARWEPGHAEVAYLKVSNAGSLAIKYRMALTVLGNTLGKTKADANGVASDIDLSKYINFGIIENVQAGAYTNDAAGRAAAITAASNAYSDGVHNFSEVLDSDADTHGWLNKQKSIIAEGEDHYFAIVVWMPETVGNEANHDGVNIPSINLGLTVFATQYTTESDSFGTDFDANAYWPFKASAVVVVPPKAERTASAYTSEARTGDGSKGASVTMPTDAIADDATEIGIDVEETKEEPNFAVVVPGAEDGEVVATKSYDISVLGLKEGNDVPVKVELRFEPGLDPAKVVLYHRDQLIPSSYNPTTGYITFESTSFSPFTVAFVESEEAYVPPKVSVDSNGNVTVGGVTATFPTASVVYKSEYVNTELPWGSYGQWSPTAGLDSKLEAAFTFSCPTNLDPVVQAAFDSWYCDFYVSLDRNLGVNQIFLGGNYGAFGWVGFHNGDVTLDANQEIGLLESVTTNPWTYADVRNFVGEFTCGVGDVNNALEGATFTVKLRLTNPKNEKEYYDVNVVTHTFGGETVIDGSKVITNVQDLQDAFAEGGNYQLGGDMDLNDLVNGN